MELSHELLGAETVVLMTIPFSNNVVTVEEMNDVNHINADIRDIARGWHLRNSAGVKRVLVQERHGMVMMDGQSCPLRLVEECQHYGE